MSFKICYFIIDLRKKKCYIYYIRGIKIKHNYLNNKDILKEIHRSKNTYCVYSDPSYADYDLIIGDVSLITPDVVDQARTNRAERLAKLAHEQATSGGEKRKLDEFAIDPTTIADSEIIFRVMTWDHVPTMAVAKKAADIEPEEEIHTEYDLDEEIAKPAAAVKYVKCNFPPFYHYKFNDTGQLTCVGKSHWKGALDTGEWCRDHGTMTRTLANMFIKLCERYATRSNWRGYTYNDEMRSQALLQLSQIGLQFDESKSQNPFAYYTAAITNSFTRVLNIEKRNQNLRDDILEMNNLNPSYTRQGLMSGGHYGDGDHD